jgi:hypothetical protein
MKSHKIWRLEFILNKIEDRDRKTKVVCIRFSCPTKKRPCSRLLVGGQPWLELELHGRRPRGLAREEREGERGARLGTAGDAMEGGCRRGCCAAATLCVVLCVLCVR